MFLPAPLRSRSARGAHTHGLAVGKAAAASKASKIKSSPEPSLVKAILTLAQIRGKGDDRVAFFVETSIVDSLSYPHADARVIPAAKTKRMT